MRMKKVLTFSLLSLLFIPAPLFAVKLPVPFTSQAPRGIWTEPWQNACEETVTVMVDFFYKGQEFTIESAEKAILDLYEGKTKMYGWSLDENAEQIADWINKFFPWEAEVVVEPSIDDIEDELDAGRPVIVPVYAPYLQNPFFSGYFAYHTIVLTGYDHAKEVFYAHEPGTSRGKEYQYSYDIIMDAMHDYLPGNTRNGPQVAIFTSPTITKKTAYTDGDNDGLLKEDEFIYGTSLFDADTDEDGYDDGTEVEAGFSPTINELGSYENLLVKSNSNPRVYIVNGRTKRHILNESVFIKNGWDWGDIHIVSRGFLYYLETGEPVR